MWTLLECLFSFKEKMKVCAASYFILTSPSVVCCFETERGGKYKEEYKTFTFKTKEVEVLR